MEAGAKITGFRAANAAAEPGTGDVNTGAVVAVTGHSFTMKGGEISGNTFSAGAVFVGVASSKFIMEGGEIRENTTDYAYTSSFPVPAVRIVAGTMEMYEGAKITENHRMAGVSVGVPAASSGVTRVFNMYGGEISCNADTEEAFTFFRSGVCLLNTPTFNMAGGKIVNNGKAGVPGSAVMAWKSNSQPDNFPLVVLKGVVEIDGDLAFGIYNTVKAKFEIEPAFENTAGPTTIALVANSYGFSINLWKDKQVLTPSNGLGAIDLAEFSLAPKLYVGLSEFDPGPAGHFCVLETDGNGNGKIGLPFVGVTGIYSPERTLPLYVRKGTAATLTSVANPSGATNKAVTWSVKDYGTVGSGNVSLTGTSLAVSNNGTLTLTGTVANGLGDGSDYSHDFTVQVLNPVTAVANNMMTSGTSTATATGTVGTEIDLNAGLSLTPTDAWWLDYPNVVWEVANPATATLLGLANGAEIAGGKFTPPEAGTYTVRLRIKGHTASSVTTTPSDFTRLLTITVSDGS
jgi:hypothetical protein